MIAHVALAVPYSTTYDYLIPQEYIDLIFAGQRVLVPFGSRYLIGVVLSTATDSAIANLKEIQTIITPNYPLPSNLIHFVSWISEYYLSSVGQVFDAALPPSIKPTVAYQLKVNIPHTFWEEITEHEKDSLLSLENKTLVQIKKTDVYASLQFLFKKAQKQGAITFQAAISEIKIPLIDSWVSLCKTVENIKSLTKSKITQELYTYLEANPQKIKKKEIQSLFPKVTIAMFNKLISLGIIEETRELEKKEKLIYNSNAFKTLTEQQNLVFQQLKQSITKNKFDCFLLHGVTGSGKTQVYLHAAKEALKQNKTVLMIVPEIMLTPQIIETFEEIFENNIAVLHSQLTPAQRAKQWWRIRLGYVSIVVGTRSAIFAPLENIGLIVIDEEHDSSYKQEETPRYHARDAAVKRASLEQAVVLLASATPSVESYYNVQQNKYTLLTLPEKINTNITLDWQTVNLQDATIKKVTGAFYISYILYDKMRETLNEGKQTLLFLNKRGFATLITCANESCKTPVFCKHCSIAMTWHKKKQKLVCHYCSYTREKPSECSVCKGKVFREEGIGTQRVEQDIQALFPKSRILRVDRDTMTTKNIIQKTLDQIHNNDFDFLIGTQMVSKGHDFKNIGLVCIVLADIGLTIPDFRSSEKAFQLISQVAGRAGRGTQTKSTVWLQSYNPNHQAISYAIQNDYLSFFNYTLEQRKILDNPPFTKQILIRISDSKEELTTQTANQIYTFLTQANKNTQTRITPPFPAPIYKIKNRYYRLIFIQTKQIQAIKKQLTFLFWQENWRSQARIALDIDPYNFL